jgi:hypothetical protein
VAHQTLFVQLDPRFSLEWLTGRRRVFGPVVAVPDRVELAWAFTALALAYLVLAAPLAQCSLGSFIKCGRSLIVNIVV